MSLLKSITLSLKAVFYVIIAMVIPFFLMALGLAIVFEGIPPSPFHIIQAMLMFPIIALGVYFAPKFFKNYAKPDFPEFDYKKLLPYLAVMVVLWGMMIAIAAYNPALLPKFPLEAKTLIERILLLLMIVVLAPIAEEKLFRDFLLNIFGEAWGKWAAIIITAALFALMHGLEPVKLALTFAFGLLFALARLNIGSLKASIILHMLNNLTAAGFLILSWMS